jgi:hypothetical protein
MRPYVGARDPIGAMATDLHVAYEHAASDYMASNPTGERSQCSFGGRCLGKRHKYMCRGSQQQNYRGKPPPAPYYGRK